MHSSKTIREADPIQPPAVSGSIGDSYKLVEHNDVAPLKAGLSTNEDNGHAEENMPSWLRMYTVIILQKCI